jgi:hypothetical protein
LGRDQEGEGPKGDKWDKGDPEAKAVRKTAEKATKAPESERLSAGCPLAATHPFDATALAR